MARFAGLNLSISLILTRIWKRRNSMTAIYNTIAFTGSRSGMNNSQIVRVMRLIDAHRPEVVRHGDCVGADAQFHKLCLAYGKCQITIHPPTVTRMRAYCKGAYETMEPEPYLDRNKDMVNRSDLLIACPAGNKEELRSGTWSTVRYARKTVTELIIIYPSLKGE